MDFEGAIKKPFSDLKKLLIGIVLMIIPIVNLMAYGYILEVARLTKNGKKNLPEWKDFGNLFVRGLLSLVIGLIYWIPVIILMIIMFVVAGAALFSGLTVGGMEGAVMGPSFASLLGMAGMMIPLVIFGMIFGLLAAYVGPSAMMHFVNKYKFGDAFKFKSVFSKAFTGKYFVAWIVGIIVSLILGLILGMIPFIGSPIAGFISGIFMFTLLAEAFRQLK